jgi:hypothetical protein
VGPPARPPPPACTRWFHPSRPLKTDRAEFVSIRLLTDIGGDTRELQRDIASAEISSQLAFVATPTDQTEAPPPPST